MRTRCRCAGSVSALPPPIGMSVTCESALCTSAGGVESLGIVETTTVAATVRAADAAVKAARVRITEMQLGRGIGGKAFFTVTGPLAEVEAAVDAALGAIDAALVHTTEIIPAPHADFVAKLR